MTGYFKKFTDFCGGFALFCALLFLFREYMSFVPKTDELLSVKEKLLMFFSKEPIRDYFLYLPLVAFLLLSLLLSITLKKAPHIGFGASLLPLCYAFLLLTQHKLYEHPMVYLILSLLHTAGNLYACIEADRLDRKRRSAFAVDLAFMGTAGFCIVILRKASVIDTLDWGELSFFEQLMQTSTLRDAPTTVFVVTATVYSLLALLRLLWRDLYFLDASLALLATAYLFYAWYAEQIPFHGTLLVFLAVLCAAARLTVMLFCKPKTPPSLQDKPTLRH